MITDRDIELMHITHTDGVIGMPLDPAYSTEEERERVKALADGGYIQLTKEMVTPVPVKKDGAVLPAGERFALYEFTGLGKSELERHGFSKSTEADREDRQRRLTDSLASKLSAATGEDGGDLAVCRTLLAMTRQIAEDSGVEPSAWYSGCLAHVLRHLYERGLSNDAIMGMMMVAVEGGRALDDEIRQSPPET